MNKIDQLDLVINTLSLSNVDNKLVTSFDLDLALDINIGEIENALDHLVKLGYANKNNSSNGYYMTYDGRLMLASTPKMFFSKPFKYRTYVQKLNNFWTIVKTIGVIANGIVLLLLAFLTYQQNNNSKIQIEEIKKLKQENQKILIENKKLKTKILTIKVDSIKTSKELK